MGLKFGNGRKRLVGGTLAATFSIRLRTADLATLREMCATIREHPDERVVLEDLICSGLADFRMRRIAERNHAKLLAELREPKPPRPKKRSQRVFRSLGTALQQIRSRQWDESLRSERTR